MNPFFAIFGKKFSFYLSETRKGKIQRNKVARVASLVVRLFVDWIVGSSNLNSEVGKLGCGLFILHSLFGIITAKTLQV